MYLGTQPKPSDEPRLPTATVASIASRPNNDASSGARAATRGSAVSSTSSQALASDVRGSRSRSKASAASQPMATAIPSVHVDVAVPSSRTQSSSSITGSSCWHETTLNRTSNRAHLLHFRLSILISETSLIIKGLLYKSLAMFACLEEFIH